MAKTALNSRRPREMPGIALLLSQVPADVRRELADQQPLFIAGFAVGWLRCAAERGSVGVEAVEEPPPEYNPARVPLRVPSPVLIVAESGPPPPPGTQEPAIGHWTPDQVAEVVGFAVVNSTNPMLARTLAVRRLQQWEPNHRELPGSWAAQLLAALEQPGAGARSIRREPSLQEQAMTFDPAQQPTGEFAQLAEAADAP